MGPEEEVEEEGKPELVHVLRDRVERWEPESDADAAMQLSALSLFRIAESLDERLPNVIRSVTSAVEGVEEAIRD